MRFRNSAGVELSNAPINPPQGFVPATPIDLNAPPEICRRFLAACPTEIRAQILSRCTPERRALITGSSTLPETRSTADDLEVRIAGAKLF